MIVYCGLRHFYIHHFESLRQNTYYILTHNKEIWDFSPDLKKYGFSNLANPKTIRHLNQPVLTIPINLDDFNKFARPWHDFSRQYGDGLEVEYPHAWYLRFKQPIIAEQFAEDFEKRLLKKDMSGIWGGGQSKLVAKLVAHNFLSGRILKFENTQKFLNQLPLSRLPLPELKELKRLGLKTVGELGELSLTELTNHFGNRAPILQRLGRGGDLMPFQNEELLHLNWSIDCTTLEGYFRPLSPMELQPYLEKGLTELASKLQARSKIAGEIEIKTQLEKGGSFHVKRVLKQPTSDLDALLRMISALMPGEKMTKISILLGALKSATTTQLSMFFQNNFLLGDTHKVPRQIAELCKTKVGIELSRREQFLQLWKEAFTDE